MDGSVYHEIGPPASLHVLRRRGRRRMYGGIVSIGVGSESDSTCSEDLSTRSTFDIAPHSLGTNLSIARIEGKIRWVST